MTDEATDARRVVMVPFEIDTSVVEQMLANKAYEEVVSHLKDKLGREIREALPRKAYGHEVNWAAFAGKIASAMVDREEITKLAALSLAKRAASTRAWKEVVDEAYEEMRDE